MLRYGKVGPLWGCYMDAVKLYFVSGKGVKECEIDLKTIVCQNMLFSVLIMANFKVFS